MKLCCEIDMDYTFFLIDEDRLASGMVLMIYSFQAQQLLIILILPNIFEVNSSSCGTVHQMTFFCYLHGHGSIDVGRLI